MSPDRWQWIEEVYNAALECPPQRRASFIAEACRGDEELRKEILDLVQRQESGKGRLLDQPAWEQAPQPNSAEAVSAASTASPAAGTRLGPYQLTARIGAGGMGQVFLARDTRLDRTVAIKFSLENFYDRFAREARVIASLNHPNICTLFDVGPDYLVMELI